MEQKRVKFLTTASTERLLASCDKVKERLKRSETLRGQKNDRDQTEREDQTVKDNIAMVSRKKKEKLMGTEYYEPKN